MRLSKHHGLGNDFLVLLDERQDGPVPVDGALARRLCDRHRGVGADGFLHGRAPSEAERAASGGEIDAVMVLYNADGSVAEMSGNGVRCFAQALASAREMSQGTLSVLTGAGVKQLVLAGTGSPHEVRVEVAMGAAAPGPVVTRAACDALADGLGVDPAELRVGTVAVGNPHLVVLHDDPSAVDLATVGPVVEAAIPGGINLEVITVLDRSGMVPASGVPATGPVTGGDVPTRIDLVVWERGVGITQACGTGACAATVQASGWGLVGDAAEVHMPGGDAAVRLGPDGEVTLIGPAVQVAEVLVGDDLRGPEAGASR